MPRPQIPPELIRVHEVVNVERQVVDFIKRKSMERKIDRRQLVREILTEWCKRQGATLIKHPPKPPKRVIPSVS